MKDLKTFVSRNAMHCNERCSSYFRLNVWAIKRGALRSTSAKLQISKRQRCWQRMHFKDGVQEEGQWGNDKNGMNDHDYVNHHLGKAVVALQKKFDVRDYYVWLYRENGGPHQLICAAGICVCVHRAAAARPDYAAAGYCYFYTDT